MLTVAAAATQLGVKEATVRVWIAKGLIGHAKLGRAVRIPAEEIAKFIRENTVLAKSTR